MAGQVLCVINGAFAVNQCFEKPYLLVRRCRYPIHLVILRTSVFLMDAIKFLLVQMTHMCRFSCYTVIMLDYATTKSHVSYNFVSMFFFAIHRLLIVVQ